MDPNSCPYWRIVKLAFVDPSYVRCRSGSPSLGPDPLEHFIYWLLPPLGRIPTPRGLDRSHLLALAWRSRCYSRRGLWNDSLADADKTAYCVRHVWCASVGGRRQHPCQSFGPPAYRARLDFSESRGGGGSGITKCMVLDRPIVTTEHLYRVFQNFPKRTATKTVKKRQGEESWRGGSTDIAP